MAVLIFFADGEQRGSEAARQREGSVRALSSRNIVCNGFKIVRKPGVRKSLEIASHFLLHLSQEVRMRHRNVAGPESDLRKGNRVSAEDGRGLYTFTDCEMSICRSAQLASYTGEYEPQICHVPPGCSQVRGFQNTQINENFFLLFVQ